ncbi:MAG: resA 1 [Planctomycetota bacterium]|nr:resA 1 [Planctomycetota bacterium]
MNRLSAFFAILVLASAARAEDINPPTLAIGAKAPDFTLKGVDDKEHSLKDFDGSKYLIIVFTCNHCPTANAYEGRLKKLVEDYKDRSVAVVAISPNDENSVRLDELGYTDLGDSFEDMKVRAKHARFNFPYLWEGDKTGIARKYGPTATPHAFLFDAERKLRYVGRIDDSERESNVKVHDLRDAIDALVAGREVKTPQTNAFGCSIKWAGKAEQVKQFMAKLAKEPVSVEIVDAAAMKALRKNDTKKLRLVNFWATWCGPCVTEFPELVTINRMYRGRAFEMVTVAANFPDEDIEVLNFLKKQQSSGRNLIFGDKEKYKLMEAFDPKWNASLPYTMLIAPGGEVLYKVQGPIDAMELKRAIVKALKEDRFR